MTQDPILIVEESSVLSDLIRDLLEATGFGVVQVSTSRDALALCRERSFAGILVDAAMPGITGLDVIKELKADADLSRIPALLLVGSDAQLPPGITESHTVHKPIDPVELITKVRATVSGLPQPIASAPTSAIQQPVGEQAPSVKLSRSPGEGKIITVFSLKGGVGTSTIAVNLAIALQRMWEESTALVDLSLESGALNILLDIMPSATIDELSALNGNMTADVVVQYLLPHKSGISLLSAPPSPERAELIEAPSIRKTIGYLKEKFDYVVIDTASTFAEYTLMALELSDHIVLPMVGDIASIRSTTTSMDIFQALSIPEEKLILVFNEMFPKMGLSRKHAETSMNVSMIPLPYGGSRLLDSINLGDPIAHSDPGNPFVEAIQAIAMEVSHPGSQARSREQGRGLLGGMRKLVKS